MSRRSRRRGYALLPLAALMLVLGLGLAASACSRSDTRLASRILDDHRRTTRSRPLPISQVLEVALSSPGRPGGVLRIEWDGRRYREATTSGGVSTTRGIQSGKAYYTDEDGVTRVVSEPVLAELTTRSFFFRRAYLFDDAERAKISLGPADASRVSLELEPHGGNPLRLTFDRATLRLVGASSTGLDLELTPPVAGSPSRWRDASRDGVPVEAELRHAGLPTDALADAAVGGWSADWPGDAATVDAPMLDSPAGAVVVAGSIAGTPATIAVDGAVHGPVRVRPELAAKLRLTFAPDVFGRHIAGGARLEIAGWREPSIHVEITDDVPLGADAAAGAPFFRETIVEYDTPARRLRLHDAARWVRAEGYYRCIMDDDGDEPVAILQKRGERVRATAGATTPRAVSLLAGGAERFRLAGPSGAPAASGSVEGLHWGPAPLPPQDFEVLSGDAARRFSASHPHVEGTLSAGFLLRFRAIIDMAHRWAYLRPESGPTPRPD
jgi:hypothetical protein